MFHDPELGRTTNGGSGGLMYAADCQICTDSRILYFFFPGSINDQSYIGNIEHLLTAKKPEQKIPTFAETIEWFNKPENRHLQFNVRFHLTEIIRAGHVMHKMASSTLTQLNYRSLDRGVMRRSPSLAILQWKSPQPTNSRPVPDRCQG
jgi:hypothetical protein